jgi:hypothetical protein
MTEAAAARGMSLLPSLSSIMQGDMAAVANAPATTERLRRIRERDEHFGPVRALYHVNLDLASGRVTGKFVLTSVKRA